MKVIAWIYATQLYAGNFKKFLEIYKSVSDLLYCLNGLIVSWKSIKMGLIATWDVL